MGKFTFTGRHVYSLAPSQMSSQKGSKTPVNFLNLFPFVFKLTLEVLQSKTKANLGNRYSIYPGQRNLGGSDWTQSSELLKFIIF